MKMLKTLAMTLSLALASSAFAQSTAPSNEQATPAVQQAETQVTETVQAVKSNLNLVNLNTATASEIQDKLVGIGAKKAQAIVDYRTKNGNFISIEQLTEVSGIGKATLDKNRDRLVLE